MVGNVDGAGDHRKVYQKAGYKDWYYQPEISACSNLCPRTKIAIGEITN
jgi:hypothetical protein